MSRYLVQSICFLFLCTSMGRPSLALAQQADASARLDAATRVTSLDELDEKPWHLKMDVTIYDAKGRNPTAGNIETWHAGKEEKTTYVLGDASWTLVSHEGKHYLVASGPEIPVIMYEALEHELHLGPNGIDLLGSIPELRKQNFGKTTLDCIMLGHPVKGPDPAPLGLFPTFCLDPGEDRIRATYNFGSETFIAQRTGKFLDHEVPVAMEVFDGPTMLASTKISELTTYAPAQNEFTPPTDAQLSGGSALISGAFIAGTRKAFVQPVYPVGEKVTHSSGTVILRAIIGRDGRIHSLRPINSCEPDFIISAISAVRQWTYKPYMLNGLPIEVDTTITVNYRLN